MVLKAACLATFFPSSLFVACFCVAGVRQSTRTLYNYSLLRKYFSFFNSIARRNLHRTLFVNNVIGTDKSRLMGTDRSCLEIP